MIVGFNVYRAPEGSAEEFCGPESLYETARAAGHVCGMAAPDKSREAEEPYDWFGPEGEHCAVAVFAE